MKKLGTRQLIPCCIDGRCFDQYQYLNNVCVGYKISIDEKCHFGSDKYSLQKRKTKQK